MVANSAQSLSLPSYDELLARVKEQDELIVELTERVARLEKRLAQYENPHTPSSAKCFKKKRKKKSRKKRGAPKGHRGATRPTPEPEEHIPAFADHCERCGSSHIMEAGVDPAVREDLIRQLQQISIIQYDRAVYKCTDCGHKFTAKHEDCPREGRFGINLLVYVTMLKFMLRGVLRKIGGFTAHVNGFTISPKGVHDVLLRVGGACKEEYLRTLERVKSAEWKYVDETGIRVNGDNWWLWIFRSPDHDVLAVIRPSRSKEVLEEILGSKIAGAGVADGWGAYSAFQVLQRCWAHLLREVDAYKKRPGGKELSEQVHRKFKKLNKFLDKDPPMEERKEVKEQWDREMEELVEEFEGYKELEKPLTYIRNGLGQWYTCLLYPGMEPTNNLGEQAMREHVLMRKIIGAFRSEKGAENYQYIASLLATWQLQGKDVYKELEELLRKELCLK